MRTSLLLLEVLLFVYNRTLTTLICHRMIRKYPSDVRPDAPYAFADNALLVWVPLLDVLRSDGDRVRGDINFLEPRAFGRAANGEEEIECVVDECGDTKAGEEGHLVNVRCCEGNVAASSAREADNVDQDARDVGGVCSTMKATGETHVTTQEQRLLTGS